MQLPISSHASQRPGVRRLDKICINNRPRISSRLVVSREITRRRRGDTCWLDLLCVESSLSAEPVHLLIVVQISFSRYTVFVAFGSGHEELPRRIKELFQLAQWQPPLPPLSTSREERSRPFATCTNGTNANSRSRTMPHIVYTLLGCMVR